jgi:hypothetical protein
MDSPQGVVIVADFGGRGTGEVKDNAHHERQLGDTSRVSFRGSCVLLVAGLVAASGGWLSGASLNAPQQQVVVVQGPAGQRALPPPPTTGTAFLAGQVVESPSGSGVGGATVTLIGGGPMGRAGSARQVAADSQGRFFFSDLPASTYTLQVVKPGYSALSAGSISRTIDVADAERITDVKVREVKLATLAGAVRDDGGDPVVGTGVLVFRRGLVNGSPTLQMAGRDRTDDRGAFRIVNLRPGDYMVCACLRDPIPFDGLLLTTLAADPLQLLGVAGRALKVGGDVASLDPSLRTFAPTFYPASLTMARAVRVTLGSGENKTGVDIDVVGARSTRVSGTIVGAIGSVQAGSMRLMPAGETDAILDLGLMPMLVQPDGRFDFSGVPPGQYVLHVTHTPTDGRAGGGPSGAALAFLGSRGSMVNPGASMAGGAPQLPNEPPQWVAELVVVGDDGVSGLSIALRPAAGMSGRLQFDGATSQPTPQALQRWAIIPQPVAAAASAGVSVNNLGRSNPDMTFRLPGMLPGRYSLSTMAVPGWPTLKSIVVAGVDVTDLAIVMEASDISDVVVTYADTPMATIGGTIAGVSSASGDLSVVVFPADRKYWTDPAAGRRRYRSLAANRNGSFTVAGGLPAGEYFIAVVPDEDTNEWQEAGKLETLSRDAQRVTLADGDKKTIEMKR